VNQKKAASIVGSPKRNGMSRDEAYGMYRNLQESVINILKKDTSKEPSDDLDPAPMKFRSQPDSWTLTMLGTIGLLAGVKGTVALLCLVGVLKPESAVASVRPLSTVEYLGVSGKSEQEIFQALDQRRATLEERRTQLDERESSVKEQEEEISIRLAELRQLTGELKAARGAEGSEMHAQVEQLSKVYVSMKPEEAAGLLQELDTMIAFDLIKQMPEKRIGQLLAIMDPKKSILITRMLAGEENVN
jgi:flagellar motility protein MotE (MotC chaperone)